MTLLVSSAALAQQDSSAAPVLTPAPRATAIPPVSVTRDLAELGPRERAYVEPIPEGYRPVGRINGWPLAIGFGVFGVSYRSAVTAVLRTLVLDGGAAAERKLPLLVPIVGPFIVRERETLEMVFGVGQAIGLSVLVVGALWPSRVLLRKDYRATVLPTVGPGTVGAAGTF
jgi:hypothetical protein